MQVPISQFLCNLIATTPNHLNIIWISIVSLLFSFFPCLNAIAIFQVTILIIKNPLALYSSQEHTVTLNGIMVSHPSCHLCSTIPFVTSSEGYLHKLNMKTLGGFGVVTIECSM
jgi:hypothetical protein